MTFDIYQNIFDADGLPLERVAREYQNKLVPLLIKISAQMLYS
jgi:hypothetical protein